MNWRRLYATIDIWSTVGLFSLFGSGCWSFLVAGLCRLLFKLEENMAMLCIGLPLFIALTTVFIRALPKHLRKAGILSDEPKTFGPWFKKDTRN
jgi:hypothetical protein